jgi:anti-sigma regulatory factor (Ser/Thr protein kinase)
VTDVALEFDRSPRSGGAARTFVRTHLLAAGLGELVETAELLVTELVTNVLVHTEDSPLVRMRVDGSSVRVAVEDHCPAVPVGGVLDVSAACGRGLVLVDALVHSWGVERSRGDGKAVWFELVQGESRSAEDLDADALLSLWGEDLPGEPVEPLVEEPPAAGPEGDGEGPTRTVRLEEVPPALLHDTKTHLDDLVRDLTLVREGAEGGSGGGDPEIVALAVRLTTLVAQLVGFRNEMRRQALAASGRGAEKFTLELHLPVTLAGPLAEYRRALDEADELCEAGRLLLAPAPPELAAFRRRKLDAFARQLADGVPTSG